MDIQNPNVDIEHSSVEIFVSIPSYRDPECQHTINDLFQKAAHPERIYVGVCFQYNKDEDELCFEHWPHQYDDHIKIERIDYKDACGPCWARARVQTLWNGEDYILSIDSHTRFVENWDSLLLELLRQCGDEKAILTTYPIGYEIDEDLPIFSKPTTTCANEFGKDGILRLIGRKIQIQGLKVIPSLFWVAGFNFCSSKVLQEVPYDPNLKYVFFGEETTMAARLWTNGWIFYTPCTHIVFHLWSREYRHVYTENGFNNEEKSNAYMRVRCILGMEETTLDLKSYGLGRAKTLRSYEEYCGVYFKDQIIETKAKQGGLDQSALVDQKEIEAIFNLIVGYQQSNSKN